MLDPRNPLAKISPLPFGLPDYQAVNVTDLEAAIIEGMSAQRKQWDAVATNLAAPTVDNTLVALDASGSLLERALVVFWTLSASVGSKELDRLQDLLSPLLSEHADVYQLDDRLYRRFLHLHEHAQMDPESAWTVAEEIRAFEREGIRLSSKQRQQLQELNVQVATLETIIEQKITSQLEDTGFGGDNLEDLAGLDEAAIARCQAAGATRGLAWFIECQNSSTQPEQSVLTRPQVRRSLLEVAVKRGSDGNPATDARYEILRLVEVRNQRAKLLGFPDHAAAVMDGETAPGPDAVQELLIQVGRAANRHLQKEADIFHRLAAADPDGDGLEAADWPYYENVWRGKQTGVNVAALQPYLELNRVLEDGVFWAARQLYGIRLIPRGDLHGWHEDVRVWEVQEENGEPIGLFLGDYFNRPGKQGGAWMAEIQDASVSAGTLPIISNDANFKKPAQGQPVYLAWDDVETLFHEFGHALHGFFSVTRYRGNAGTNVPRDFVELPSQLNEMWAFHPKVLRNFARHHSTGDRLPEKLVQALSGARTFGQAFSTVEYVAAAVIDLAWHRQGTQDVSSDPQLVDAFEDKVLSAVGLKNQLVPPRYRTPYFAHTFAGGYDAGYYAYMWAEMLCAEVEDWFKTVGAQDGDGGLNRQAGQKFRDELLSRGDSRDPIVSFEALTGSSASINSVLRRRGLT